MILRLCLVAIALLAVPATKANPFSPVTLPVLQSWIDATPDGATLIIPPGTYAGPVVIARPMTVEGGGKVTVDGGGKGTVLSIRASCVTLRGLHLKNSGSSHDGLDSGLLIERGNNNLIEKNVIDDVIFGITLQQSNENRVVGNRVSSRYSGPRNQDSGLSCSLT